MTTTMSTADRNAKNLATVKRWIAATSAEVEATRGDGARRFDYFVALELRDELGYFARQAKAGTLDALEVSREAVSIRRAALSAPAECADDELDAARKLEVAAQIASLATELA